jgi:hypothetical protein
MYTSHTEFERRERNRELMRAAERDRLVCQAMAGTDGRANPKRAHVEPGEWLMARAAALASFIFTFTGQQALHKGL